VLAFFAVVFTAIILIHLYLWKRLVRDTLRPGRVRRIGALAAVVLAVLVPATIVGTRTGSAEWLAWPGYLWIAAMFYLLVSLIVLEVPRLVIGLVLRARDRAGAGAAAAEPSSASASGPAARRDPGEATELAASATPRSATATAEPDDTPPAEKPGIERRLLLARGAAVVAGLATAGIAGYGVRTALGPPQLARLQFPLAKLPRALDGTRLAVVSDIHLGALTGLRRVGRIVDLINSVDPDIVCIVGDLVDGTVEELGRYAEPLAGIRSRRGAYLVTGNHEYYSGFAPWVEEVARLGVRPLRNERVELGGLDLAGVNDLNGSNFGDPPDFGKALGDRDRGRPVILMAHQPIAVHDAAPYGVDLQVSGHTHGGQMVPFNLVVRMEQPIVSGLGRVDGVPVYVTNGAGFWGPPVRVGAPPQVSVIDLRTP
jgi:predicted MPP superfamily phosphohydrolase